MSFVRILVPSGSSQTGEESKTCLRESCQHIQREVLGQPRSRCRCRRRVLYDVSAIWARVRLQGRSHGEVQGPTALDGILKRPLLKRRCLREPWPGLLQLNFLGMAVNWEHWTNETVFIDSINGDTWQDMIMCTLHFA
ncbi:hypothetical protein M3J09_007371 [Ascochyta lentis]